MQAQAHSYPFGPVDAPRLAVQALPFQPVLVLVQQCRVAEQGTLDGNTTHAQVQQQGNNNRLNAQRAEH